MNESQSLKHLLNSRTNSEIEVAFSHENNLLSFSEENSHNFYENEDDLVLLKRIEQRFKPLNFTETKLFESLEAQLSDLNKPEQFIFQVNERGDEYILRAELLACICKSLHIQEKLPSQGLKLEGVEINGDFNIAFARINIPLHFFKCTFTDKLLLEQGQLRKLNLEGTQVNSITADRANIEGNVELNNGFFALNMVSFVGATIGGTFNCEGGKFGKCKDDTGAKDPNKTVLLADGIDVRRSIFLRRNFCAEGKVSLIGATIGSNLDCNSGRFINSNDSALVADGIAVKGSIFLNKKFHAEGVVRLIKATIGNDLYCGGHINNGKNNIALLATRIDVKGDVNLISPFQVKGEIKLDRANICGSLKCRIKFTSEEGIISMEGATISQSVQLDNTFCINGKVILRQAIIGNVLEVREDIDATLDLEYAKAQDIEFRGGNSWTRCKLKLNGLVYDAINFERGNESKLVRNQSTWFKQLLWHEPEPIELNWLRQQLEKKFLPQPYEQLATVLKSHGKEGEAIQVLIGKEDDRRKYDGLKRFGKIWNLFLGVSIGHGYKPGRAVWAALGLLFIGMGIFGYGDSQKLMSPATDSFISKASISEVCQPTSFSHHHKEIDACPNYPKFNPFSYSLDVLLPVVDLHLESYWIPNVSWLRYYLWVHIIMGWILTSLIVAGFSGLVRTSK